MKILLTGANGFIGQYFYKNYSSKYEIVTFSFLNDNLNELNLETIDIVVHLSALVHKMDGASLEAYFRVNVNNTLALAKKAKESAIKHFIFMSTVKVYGEESDALYKENTPCNPQDDYGKSKLEAEVQLRKLDDNHFKVSIIRTPIVYGHGVKANLENLIKLVKKTPILPFSKINNRRSMVYVGNLCDIIDTIIFKQKAGTFLAADNYPISTSQLIELIAIALNKRIFLISIPWIPFLIKRVKPTIYRRLYENLEVDNTHTKNILNFSNRYSVNEGIQSMIKKDI